MSLREYHSLRIKLAPPHSIPLKRTIPLAEATGAVRMKMECSCEFIEVECGRWYIQDSIVRQQEFSKSYMFLFV